MAMKILDKLENFFKTAFGYIIVALVTFVATATLIPSVKVSRTVQVIEHNCTDHDGPVTPNKNYSL